MDNLRFKDSEVKVRFDRFLHKSNEIERHETLTRCSTNPNKKG